MIKIPIQSADKVYEALVGSKLIESAGSIVSHKLRPTRCAVITDENTGRLFATSVQQSLTRSGFRPTLITVSSGESSKTLASAGMICERMVRAGMDRDSFVLGLGGGVIGDLSGFAAAIFHRGVPHVQVPTTLLAMVDSSIGGKTGVNTGSAKNLIGAVHQPAVVIDDVDVLQTLPEREFKQGFAEIIKHSIIADAQMFQELGKMQLGALRPIESNRDALAKLIGRNIEIKAGVVRGDTFDRSGGRAILNFGHTVGHGIEQAGEYEQFMHGEAISLGMVAATMVSVKRAGLTTDERDAIVGLLGRYELPTQLPREFPRERIIEALKFDKKFQQGEIRYVVMPRIGAAYLSKEVTLDDIREAIEAL